MQASCGLKLCSLLSCVSDTAPSVSIQTSHLMYINSALKASIIASAIHYSSLVLTSLPPLYKPIKTQSYPNRRAKQSNGPPRTHSIPPRRRAHRIHLVRPLPPTWRPTNPKRNPSHGGPGTAPQKDDSVVVSRRSAQQGNADESNRG